MLLWAAITENTMTFDEDLVDINNQSSSVSQGVSFLDPFNNRRSVFLVIASWAEVAGTEDVGGWFDDKMIMWDDPVVINRGNLLNLFGLFVVVDCCCPWTEDGDDCIDLLLELNFDQFSLIYLPNGENASNGKVCVNNWASVKGVKGDHIAIALTDLDVGWSFLAGEGLHKFVVSEMFLNNLIAVDILV